MSVIQFRGLSLLVWSDTCTNLYKYRYSFWELVTVYVLAWIQAAEVGYDSWQETEGRIHPHPSVSTSQLPWWVILNWMLSLYTSFQKTLSKLKLKTHSWLKRGGTTSQTCTVKFCDILPHIKRTNELSYRYCSCLHMLKMFLFGLGLNLRHTGSPSCYQTSYLLKWRVVKKFKNI